MKLGLVLALVFLAFIVMFGMKRKQDQEKAEKKMQLTQQMLQPAPQQSFVQQNNGQPM